jgi:hypothetical protein
VCEFRLEFLSYLKKKKKKKKKKLPRVGKYIFSFYIIENQIEDQIKILIIGENHGIGINQEIDC